jgi:hypothetical protein
MVKKINHNNRHVIIAIFLGLITFFVGGLFANPEIPEIFVKPFIWGLLTISTAFGYLLFQSIFDIWAFATFEYSKPTETIRIKKNQIEGRLLLFWFPAAMAGIIFVLRHL